jgi:hypothetical protein
MAFQNRSYLSLSILKASTRDIVDFSLFRLFGLEECTAISDFTFLNLLIIRGIRVVLNCPSYDSHVTVTITLPITISSWYTGDYRVMILSNNDDNGSDVT